MRIEQILLNLTDNSLKYTNAGKIKVTTDYESIDKNNVNIIISVKDTGCGITNEDKNNLFTSFKRLEEDKNRMFEGTGLGLAITKKLVDAMNGSIFVESDVGVGSCFKVTIPHSIVESKVVHDTVKEEKPADTLNTKDELNIPNVNILAVDDNSTNLLVFKGLLKKTNAKIDTCTKGSEALELFKNNNYDIIFLDHMMPEMDGVEVLNHIKEIEKDKNTNTPVIVLTANAMEGSKEEYLKYGFNDYLSKPVNGASLKNMLKKFLIDSSNANDEKQDIKNEKTTEETKSNNKKEASQNENIIEKNTEIERQFIDEKNDIEEEKPKEESKVEETINTVREFIEDRKENVNSELVHCFERINKIKDNNFIDLEGYINALEEFKKISKEKGFTKLAQRAYVHLLKSKDKDIEYLKEHFIDLENEYNKVK